MWRWIEMSDAVKHPGFYDPVHICGICLHDICEQDPVGDRRPWGTCHDVLCRRRKAQKCRTILRLLSRRIIPRKCYEACDTFARGETTRTQCGYRRSAPRHDGIRLSKRWCNDIERLAQHDAVCGKFLRQQGEDGLACC